MSNIFIKYPPLVGLYNRWAGDPIEYGAAALLQNIVIIFFKIEDSFCPAFEQPPDLGSRRNYRIDVLIFEHNIMYSAPGLLVPRLLLEMKGGGGSSKAVESQALANARASIQQYSLVGLFVQTVLGIERALYFRFWWMDSVSLQLQPLDGGPKSGSRDGRSAYVELSTEGGNKLESYYNQVKSGTPIIPTEEHGQDPLDPLAQEVDHSADNLPNETLGYEGDAMMADIAAQQGGVSESEPEEMDQEAGAGPSQAPQGTGQSRNATPKRIEITYESHTLRKDKFLFRKHKKGRIHSTEIEDWDVKRTRDGEVWTWKKDKKYWGYRPHGMSRR
ncbi:hypothetical protein CGRA01v4_05964 [Colletotrichum graminicola]|uniref:Uncharacterized protein n=1 Tax=Colletotrichum graminicola (strain M1.001 / M2 / FGSC 10212) TaxID=645133 RepID=E3R0Z6_COLGM|nr:uncharacterized protein GLRG_11931 [Colletotrichum graminicola M1.001]EFQ36784.1 hypothetical protein GLRG_11931 [Colletotrichum graminicola M1.001]WDK14683.1 hypothetical protein CGRA01v4_05964 [Colletotrichum graminicola]